MQSIKTLAVVCCTSLSACGGCEQPKHVPQPVADKGTEVVIQAARGYQSASDNVSGAFVGLINGMDMRLNNLSESFAAFKGEMSAWKVTVEERLSDLSGSVKRLDKTLEVFIPAVDARFDSLEARVDRLEGKQPAIEEDEVVVYPWPETFEPNE